MCTNLWLWKLSAGMAGAVVLLFAFFLHPLFFVVSSPYLQVLCRGLLFVRHAAVTTLNRSFFFFLLCLTPFMMFVDLNGSVRYLITLRWWGAKRWNLPGLTELQEYCPSNSRTCSWGPVYSQSLGQADYGHYAVISREAQFITSHFFLSSL